MARAVMHLVHKTSDGMWHLEQSGTDLGSYESKAEAEQDGKRRGNEFLAKGLDAQLVIHREDGSIETEYTYGHDPRNIPG